MKKIKRLFALLLTAVLCFSLAGCAAMDYSKAGKLMDSGDYSAALELFESLDDYKDSADQARECRYQLALEALDADDIDGAEKQLALIPGYKDSAELVNECSYRRAVSAMDSGDLETAIKLFSSLDVYKDSVRLKREAEETLAMQNLIGTWTGRGDAVDALKDATGGYIEAAPYDVTLVFSEDGSYSYTLDLTPAKPDLHRAMYNSMLDQLNAYGISEAEFESYYGQTLDEYIDESIDSGLELVDYGGGSYSIDDGVLVLDPGTSGAINIDYDGTTMSLTTALGPATLTKAS